MDNSPLDTCPLHCSSHSQTTCTVNLVAAVADLEKVQSYQARSDPSVGNSAPYYTLPNIAGVHVPAYWGSLIPRILSFEIILLIMGQDSSPGFH